MIVMSRLNALTLRKARWSCGGGMSGGHTSLEIRLEGATGKVRSYLEDDTTSSSLSGAIARLLDSVSELISGQDSLQDAIDDLDRRVTALEEAT